MSEEKQAKSINPELAELAKLEALAVDQSEGEGAVVLREVARLQLEIKYLKTRNVRVWAVVVGLTAILFFVLMSFVLWYPKYRYIATTNNAAICQVATESGPRVTPTTLAEFAKDGVLNAFSFDYIHYNDQLKSATDRWFTEDGRKAFMRSLDESKNLETVIKGRLILRSMAMNVPQLEEEGQKSGRKYWIVRVPITVEFYAGGETQPRTTASYLSAVTIVQVAASATNIKGIGVDSVALTPITLRK